MIAWTDTDTSSTASMGAELTASIAYVQGQWQGQIIMGGALSSPVAIFAADAREPVRVAIEEWLVGFSANLSAWVGPAA